MRSLACAIALLACSPAAPPQKTAMSAKSGVCWPVVQLRFEALEHGKEWEPIVTLAADGAITHTQRGSLGKLEADRVITKSGELRCDAERVVHMTGNEGIARYDDTDTLLVDNLMITIRDDGEVVMALDGKPGPRARIAGDLTAKRTGALLALMALAGAH